MHFQCWHPNTKRSLCIIASTNVKREQNLNGIGAATAEPNSGAVQIDSPHGIDQNSWPVSRASEGKNISQNLHRTSSPNQVTPPNSNEMDLTRGGTSTWTEWDNISLNVPLLHPKLRYLAIMKKHEKIS